MGKIAVMGDYDSIYGFAAIGLDTFPAANAEEGEEQLKKLDDGVYGIIYITEELAEQMKKTIAKYDLAISPAIIPIPGVKGNTGNSVEAVKKFVEQAVGSDILFNSNKE